MSFNISNAECVFDRLFKKKKREADIMLES